MATDQGMYVRDGILCVEATRAGVPCFTFEIGEGGRVEEAATETGTRCVLNAMRHLGMLPAVTEPPIPSVRMSAFLGLRAYGRAPDHRRRARRASGEGRHAGEDSRRVRRSGGDGHRASRRLFRPLHTFAAVASGERVATLGVD